MNNVFCSVCACVRACVCVSPTQKMPKLKPYCDIQNMGKTLG